MNLVEISETLKGAPDDFLVKHVQNPDGSIPQFMALSELQRRKDMRERFAAPQGPQSTVAEDLTGGQGIAASAEPQMPPAPQAGPEAGIQGYRYGGYIDRVAGFESGNNPNAKNPYSSASGLYQLIDSTRASLDKRYGFDPRDRSAATERARMEAYTNETASALRKRNLPVSGGTLYGGHLLGQAGVTNFLNAYLKNPDAKPSSVFSAEVIKKNPAIFSKARTLEDVMKKFDEVGGEGIPSGIKDRKDIAGRRVSDKNMSGILSLLSDEYEPVDDSSAFDSIKGLLSGSQKKSSDIGAEQHAAILKSLGVPGYANQGSVTSPPLPAGSYQQLSPKQIVWNGKTYRYAEQVGQWVGPDGYLDPNTKKVDPDPVARGDEIISGASSPPPKGIRRNIQNASNRQSRFNASLLPEELSPEWSIQDDDAGGTQILKSAGQLGYNAIKTAALPGNALLSLLQSTVGGAMLGGADLADWLRYSPAERRAARSGIAAAPSKWTDVQLERPPGYGPETTTPEGIKTAVTRPAPEILPPEAPPQAAPADPLDGIINDFLAEYKASRSTPEERKQMALLQAGLGMMAGDSPWAMVNIGRGGMTGVAAYQDAKKADAQMAESALNNALKIQALRGQQEDRQFDREYKRDALEIQRQRAQAYIEKATQSGLTEGMTREQHITFRQIVDRTLASKKDPLTGESVPLTFNDIVQAIKWAKAGIGMAGAVAGDTTEEDEGIDATQE